MSAYLLAELAKRKISFVITDEKHNPVGQYLPLYGAHNMSGRLKDQISWSEPSKKRVWQVIVKEKIQQQAYVLESRGQKDDADKINVLVNEVKSGDTTNREAHAARLYFRFLFGEDFKREADCELNAALNYGYAVLLSVVNREVISRGYLTEWGIFHRNENNQFNLSCDFMEPFRPVIDRIVLDNFDSFFDSDIKNVLCNFENVYLHYKDGLYKASSVVSLYIQDVLSALNKRISVEEIESFRML